MDINFFNSIAYLEPKCPGCKTVLDYGVNTEYNEDENTNLCTNCGYVLE